MNDLKNIENEIFSYLDSKKEEMVELLSDWIKVPSVANVSNDENSPLGDECLKMLEKSILDANKMGIENCKNHYNRVATIDLNDKKPVLGVMCHLDVVSADSKGWDHLPFNGDYDLENVYGRGASDNKSAGVAALFALEAIKKFVPTDKNIRLYFGCAEEIGSPCIKHYTKYVQKPEDMPPTIVPDAGNSIIYGEWGVQRIILSSDISDNDSDIKLISLNCGEAFNIIPSLAEAKISSIPKEEIEKNFSSTDCTLEVVETEDGYITVKVHGKSCHSSEPQNGKNSAIAMLSLLSKLSFGSVLKNTLNFLMEFYKNPPQQINEALSKNALTFSLTGLFFEDNKLTLWHDSRLSQLISAKSFVDEFNKYFKNSSIDVCVNLSDEPHFVDKDGEFIRKLKQVYEDFSKEEAEVIEIKAATYASQIDMGVAYGQFEGYNLHGINEYIPIENIVKTSKLLALTMLNFINE